MRKSFGLVLFVSLLGVVFGVETLVHAAPAVVWPQIGLKQLAGGLASPTNITNAADGTGRIFVTEQVGRIRLIKAGVLLSTPFLDITARVTTTVPNGGQGLIGLAFPPAFATRKHFYVDYTNNNGDIVISRFGMTANPDIADPQSEAILLTIPHPGSVYHYGGQLAFGPNDGYLYISVGDGDASGDPNNYAQTLSLLLGKILRIDVEGGTNPYALPPTNPFTQTVNARGEIWAYGFRNPWRFSFDRATGDLYIGDVGNNTYEEVDFQPAAAPGGLNYGWPIMEGNHCTNPSQNPCPPAGLTTPVYEYTHSPTYIAVTGGYVYRGPHNQLMQAKYFYGDVSGHMGVLAYNGSFFQQTWLSDVPAAMSTFGEDELGNLYVTDYTNGVVYLISTAGVDGWLSGPASVPALPGIVSTTVTLGNYGLMTATSVIVTATLPAGVTYAGSLPAPSSHAGNTVTWTLPDLVFQSSAQISLSVHMPVAPAGTLYPITWQLGSAGPEANPADNTLTTQLVVKPRLYLPLIRR